MGDHSAIQRSKVLIYPTTSQNCRSIMLDTEDIQYGILFIWNSRKGETNKQHQIVVVGWGIRRKECKGVQGNVSGWSKYFISWLWQWLHGDKHLSILIKPYILNSAMLLYVNYTSINVLLAFHYECIANISLSGFDIFKYIKYICHHNIWHGKIFQESKFVI